MFSVSKEKTDFKIKIDEQDILFGILRNDPRVMSHMWGSQIQTLQQDDKASEDHIQDRINEIYTQACENFSHDPKILAQIIRTMVISYGVNTQLVKLPIWDTVHKIIGDYVLNHLNSIEIFK